MQLQMLKRRRKQQKRINYFFVAGNRMHQIQFRRKVASEIVVKKSSWTTSEFIEEINKLSYRYHLNHPLDKHFMEGKATKTLMQYKKKFNSMSVKIKNDEQINNSALATARYMKNNVLKNVKNA